MKFVIDIKEKDMSNISNVALPIFLNDIFVILEKHLSNIIDSVVVTLDWKEIVLVLVSSIHKKDFIMKHAEKAIAEINEKYEFDGSIRAYSRFWTTGPEINISFTGR